MRRRIIGITPRANIASVAGSGTTVPVTSMLSIRTLPLVLVDPIPLSVSLRTFMSEPEVEAKTLPRLAVLIYQVLSRVSVCVLRLVKLAPPFVE